MANELPVEKFCVVCGAGSHREDWRSVKFPACDSHSKSEIDKAIQAAIQAKR